MLGYACTRMRYYHPLEFTTAYLNRANNEDDINMGTELANLLGFKIIPARFRYSTNEYTFDKSTNTIYKGVASIKNLNHEVAEQLYSLRYNKYNNFYELMLDIKDKVNIRSDQLTILIKLDYFKESGKAKKLLNYIPYFNDLYKAKVVNKEKFSDDIEQIIAKYSRQTEKQFRDLDNEKILTDIWNIIPNEDLSMYEKIDAEKEYLGYISYTDSDIDKRYVMVMDLDTKYSPKFTGYCLNNGKIQEIKVYKQKKGRGMKGVIYYKDTPFEDGDVLFCKKFKPKPKSIKTEDGWKPIPNTKEWWLTNYSKADIIK